MISHHITTRGIKVTGDGAPYFIDPRHDLNRIESLTPAEIADPGPAQPTVELDPEYAATLLPSHL